MELLAVFTTVPDGACAEKIAQAAVAQGLAACVQQDSVHSTYAWQGQIHSEPEVRLLLLYLESIAHPEMLAAAAAHARERDLPIIAITGHEDLNARVQDCGGVFGIFQKPWNDRELLRRVAALTQLSETVRQTPRFDAGPVQTV